MKLETENSGGTLFTTTVDLERELVYKLPVHNSLKHKVSHLECNLFLWALGYLSLTEVSTYNPLLHMWMGSNKIFPFYSIDNYSVSWYFAIF